MAMLALSRSIRSPQRLLLAHRISSCQPLACFSTYTANAKGTNTLDTPTPAGGWDGSLNHDSEPGTTDYRLRFNNPFGKEMSPWHDIRLQCAEYGFFNAVIKNPKGSDVKMEVMTAEEHNPLGHGDTVHRYYEPLPYNFGFLPETWSNPLEEDANTKSKGDSYPLDIVEIGSAELPAGTVVPVKPLGIFALQHSGVMHWKIITLQLSDPLAKKMHDLEHLEAQAPEIIDHVRDWFRSFESADGKASNSYGYDEACMPRAKANEVIAICFDEWRKLRFGEIEGNCGLWTKTVKAWAEGL